MASPIDLDKLDYAALKQLIEDASAKADEKRENEVKTLVNGVKLKADQRGITVSELITELQAYLPADHSSARKTRAPRGSVVKEEKAYVKGVTYKNPKSDETWMGGAKGRRPPWLRDLVPDSLSHDEMTKKFASLAVK